MDRGRVSGYTTGKVTAGHGLIYSHLEGAFDAETARLYADSQITALSHIRELCEGRSIDCDFESRPNYLFAETKAEVEQLELEAAAARRAGLPVSLVRNTDTPIPADAVLRLDEQAQFHTRRYLLELASFVTRAGGRIVESSRVTDVSGDGPYLVSATAGTVKAKAVIVATHYPVVEGGFFVKRIHPRRSYIVAAPLEAPDFDGMFINISTPTHSFRTAPLPDGSRLLLVGGEGHRVGQEDDTDMRYELLEGYLTEHFSAGEVEFRWSTQDNFTLDGLPFVGRTPGSENVFVATGFGGWGLTNGTAAALAISDAIQGRPNTWAGIYDLDRRSVVASARRFVTQAVNMAAQEIGSHLPTPAAAPNELEPARAT